MNAHEKPIQAIRDALRAYMADRTLTQAQFATMFKHYVDGEEPTAIGTALGQGMISAFLLVNRVPKESTLDYLVSMLQEVGYLKPQFTTTKTRERIET